MPSTGLRQRALLLPTERVVLAEPYAVATLAGIHPRLKGSGTATPRPKLRHRPQPPDFASRTDRCHRMTSSVTGRKRRCGYTAHLILSSSQMPCADVLAPGRGHDARNRRQERRCNHQESSNALSMKAPRVRSERAPERVEDRQAHQAQRIVDDRQEEEERDRRMVGGEEHPSHHRRKGDVCEVRPAGCPCGGHRSVWGPVDPDGARTSRGGPEAQPVGPRRSGATRRHDLRGLPDAGDDGGLEPDECRRDIVATGEVGVRRWRLGGRLHSGRASAPTNRMRLPATARVTTYFLLGRFTPEQCRQRVPVPAVIRWNSIDWRTPYCCVSVPPPA